MNKLQAGFSRLNINPPMGTPINGYYKPRHVEGFLDDLEVVALARRADEVPWKWVYQSNNNPY